jgi:hypothetical protein
MRPVVRQDCTADFHFAVLLHNDNWASDVEGFWHKGSQSWSANTRIPGIENRVISAEPPTHWKPLKVEEEKY